MGSFETRANQAKTLSARGQYLKALEVLGHDRSKSFAVLALAKNIQHQAQRNHSIQALGILQTFLGQAKESLPMLEHLNQSIQSGKTLKTACHSLTPLEQFEISEKVGEENLNKIFSIAQNIDPNNFWEETIHFGVELKQGRQLEAAAAVLSLASQDFVPILLRQRAETETKAILGQGSAELRVELLLSTLGSEATSYHAIFPMLGASIIGETVGSLVLGKLAGAGRVWYSRGLGARVLAGSAAYLSEASAFGLTSHVLNSSRGSLGQDLESSAISLGVLRLFGYLGNQAFLKIHALNEMNLPSRLAGLAKFNQWALPQSAVFGGLLFAHKAEEGLGLRPPVDDATIAGLDLDPLRAKTPLRFFFIAGGQLDVRQHNRREIDPFDPIGDEIHARAVARLICVAGRINKKSGLRTIVPFGVAAGDALLIALVENHVAVGDQEILGVVNGDLVRLQTISSDARVDIAFTDRDATFLGLGR